MKARLEIQAVPSLLEPTLQFVTLYGNKAGLRAEKLLPLREALQAALWLLIETNTHAASENSIAIELEEAHGKFLLSILNRGVPIFAAPPGSVTRHFHEAAQKLDRFSIQNLGRSGQQIRFETALLQEAATETTQNESQSVTDWIHSLQDDEIQVRLLMADEAASLSELFYFVYGYRYIHEFVYFPEKIRSKIESCELISTVASLPNGKIVGHVGLLRMNTTPPVTEVGLGVVHPLVKSRGVFGKLFRATLERVQQIPMQYCFFDFVTNHDFTQRFVSQFSPVDLALLVGCQTHKTQAQLEKLGLGPDPTHMNRYSLLASCLPRTAFPFGREVVLPEILGEQIGFLLEPLQMLWTPPSRFDPLPEGGEYSVEYQPAQGAVTFDFFDPGRAAAEKLLATWEDLLRNGYQYAGIQIPLETAHGKTPGLGTLYNLLSSSGFFVGGFMPYRYSDRLALRLQALGPVEVGFDEIKVFSSSARKLLKVIQQESETASFHRRAFYEHKAQPAPS